MSKVKIVPCSGIGKVYGLMAREAVLKVTDELCPDIAETVCLAHLVTGEEEALEKVSGKSCITVDGCTALCARLSVEAAGGIVKQEYRSIDEMKKHRGKKPGDGSTLTDDGWQIVDDYALIIAGRAKELYEEDSKNGG